MHWLVIAILVAWCVTLDTEVQKLKCKANGLDWGANTQSWGVHCKTPERGG